MSRRENLAVRAVSFDATGTLFHSPRLGEIYAEVLTRHDPELEGARATPEQILRGFRLAWRELDCRVPAGVDRYRTHPGGASGFWQELLERLCLHLGLEPPSRFAAAELYERFAEAGAWELFPEVPSVIETLRSRGFAIAVISNWDDRLPRLLAALGLGERIDHMLTSHADGAAKPSRVLFHRAARALGVEPTHLLHVGDSQIEDLEGALAAGCQALRLDRSGEVGDLETLEGLPDRLQLARPVAAPSGASTEIATSPQMVPPMETETP